MDKKIEIFTFIGRNSEKYAEFLRWHCEKMKSGQVDIFYKCILSLGSERTPEGWRRVDKITNDLGHNCLNHAAAIHSACKLVTESNVVFIDADTCILYKDWDLTIIEALKRVDIYGTAFPDNANQYNKFPNVFMFCFRRDVLQKVNLDFNPLLNIGIESPVKLKIKTTLESKAYNKKIGDTLKCDTGYMLPFIASINNLTYDYIPASKERLLPYRDDDQYEMCLSKHTHMAEWHIGDKIFITHKQASRNHPLDGSWGAMWKERIGFYTQKEYGFVF